MPGRLRVPGPPASREISDRGRPGPLYHLTRRERFRGSARRNARSSNQAGAPLHLLPPGPASAAAPSMLNLPPPPVSSRANLTRAFAPRIQHAVPEAGAVMAQALLLPRSRLSPCATRRASAVGAAASGAAGEAASGGPAARSWIAGGHGGKGASGSGKGQVRRVCITASAPPPSVGTPAAAPSA